MPARDLSQDWHQLLQDHASGRAACEDELDHAVVERVYGIAPPSQQRARRRAHACTRRVEKQD